MTRRVLLPLLLFGLIAVCAILVPIGDAIATSRTQQVTLQRASSIDQIVQRVRATLNDGHVSTLANYLERFHQTYGEAVIVVDETGEIIATVGDLALNPEVDALILAAARTVPQRSLPTVRPWSANTALVAEPVTTDSNSTAGAVVLAVDLTAAKSDVTLRWLAIAGIGVLLLTALLAASLYWTRWVLRPVRALDAATNALAENRERAPTDTSGPPELRQLTDSFARMARGIEDALEQQRGFVADASHQLRNPLAAIRLRIDALEHKPGDIAELDAVDRDLDRLEHTVHRMLALANAEHRATVNTSGQVSETADDEPRECVVSANALAEPHRLTLQATGVGLVAVDNDDVRVPCTRRDLEEIVEILVDNARKYAGAGATVWLSLVADYPQVVFDISDSGSGLTDSDLTLIGTRFWRSSQHSSTPGTGLGIAIVEQLARANHAGVSIDRAAQGGLRLRVRWVTV